MRILVVADKESPFYWDHYEPGKLDGIDLIISCGDLKPQYLSFLATFTKAPVLYVHGNHDERYETNPPEGCVCIDDSVYVFNGVRIAGLGGSMRYNYGTRQYTERQMRQRYRRLLPSIFFRRGIDILITHAPAFELNDADDLPHRGFKVFKKILDKYKPKYFVHGHVHMNYNHRQPRLFEYGETTIVNAYERYIIEYDS